MEPVNEKTYTSPQRKLVKFFERSRNQWKAKSGAAKTVLKRLGPRMRRLERSNADYQHQLAILQTQVADDVSMPQLCHTVRGPNKLTSPTVASRQSYPKLGT